MIDTPNDMMEGNRRAVERRDAFRRDLAAGKTTAKEFQTLKHQFPYIGFVACNIGGMQLQLFHCNDDLAAWEFFWMGENNEDPVITRKWIEWARNASEILDIGAYTGLMSILAGLANPTCRIHAFEPIDRTVERMKINLRANGIEKRVTLHAKAASDSFGFEMMNYYRGADFLGSGNSIHDKGKDPVLRRLIETVNVDQYLGTSPRFDLVKIDVEGFETHVLKGLEQTIGRCRPRILLELWQENEAAVFSILNRLGYAYERVETAPARVTNYLCEPRTRARGAIAALKQRATGALGGR